MSVQRTEPRSFLEDYYITNGAELPNNNGIPLPGPTAELSADPDFQEACERLGFDPQEWRHYSLPGALTRVQFNGLRRRLAKLDAEQAAIRAEWEKQSQALEEIIAFNPGRIRRAMGSQSNTGRDRRGGSHV